MDVNKKCRQKHRRRRKRILTGIGIFLAAIIIGCAAFIGNVYYAQVDVSHYLGHVENVTTMEMGQDIGEGSEVKGLWIDGTGTEELLIFYPGARVEYTAYLPLLYDLAAKGTDCYLVKMPMNMAFFEMNAATKVMEQTKGMYESYYVAGHSLGGAMAASCVSKELQTSDQIKGLVLLASYPTRSLDQEGFQVRSIYGSEDKILNKEKLVQGRDLMPSDYAEVCIEGGNHAGFGSYGEQKGDGKALIHAEDQQSETIACILEMIGK